MVAQETEKNNFTTLLCCTGWVKGQVPYNMCHPKVMAIPPMKRTCLVRRQIVKNLPECMFPVELSVSSQMIDSFGLLMVGQPPIYSVPEILWTLCRLATTFQGIMGSINAAERGRTAVNTQQRIKLLIQT